MFRKVIRVMTEKEYYLWPNKFNSNIIGESMQLLQLLFTKIYTAALIFEFFNSDLTKQKYIVQIMKCKLPIKTTEK